MINLSEHDNELITQINELRTNPSSFKDSFTLVSKALSRIPKKKKEAKELEDVANSLTDIKPLEGFKLSPGLCLAATDIINHMKKLGKLNHIKLDEYDLKEHIRAYTRKSNKVFQIIDIGGSENILARSMISENDLNRTNKKALFDTDFQYCGLSSHEVEDEITTVIILADYIEEGNLARTYNPEDYPEIKEAFDLFDINEIGKIDAKEAKKVMENLGFHIKNPMIYAIMNALDIPENYLGVTFDALMDEITSAVGDEMTKDGLYRIFCLYKDSTNVITLGGLKQMTIELDEKDLTHEIELLSEQARTNGNYITFDDFYRILAPVVVNEEN